MIHRTWLAVAAVVLLPACGERGPGTIASLPETAATAPGAPNPPSGEPPRPAPQARPARVHAVLDGDSIEALVDGELEEIRILGVNAPERGECWSDRARRTTADLLEGADVVLLAAGRDQYGRLLAHLWADGVSVGLTLIERGAALAASPGPDSRAAYLAAEEAAYSAGLGLWAGEACGPRSEARITIADARFDAPGPDHENPNGEWVVLANGGPAVDLTGWVLRDGSSIHRFAFPPGFVLAPGSRVTVFSGCGVDGPDALFWCAGAVWSNSGDVALVLDPAGNVVDRLRA